MFDGGRLVGKIAAHSVEGNKDFSSVEAIVTGILFFGFHYANDGIRNAIHPNGLTEGFAFSEQLFFGITAEERNVAGVFIVFVVVEAALRSGDAANFAERRKRANYWNRSTVVKSANLDIAAKFWHGIFAGGRFGGDLQIIIFSPVDEAAGASAPAFHSGAAGANESSVLAEGFPFFLDSPAAGLAQPHPGCDGEDSPGRPRQV